MINTNTTAVSIYSVLESTLTPLSEETLSLLFRVFLLLARKHVQWVKSKVLLQKQRVLDPKPKTNQKPIHTHDLCGACPEKSFWHTGS